MSKQSSQKQSNTELSNLTTSPFDAYRFTDDHGTHRWSARDLQEPLGYEKWENFHNVVIERAIASCTNVGQDRNYHFPDVGKPIISGKGREQKIQDYHLTKFGAFLVAMNGDPNKPEIAAAQAYFAIMTILAENILYGNFALDLTNAFAVTGIIERVIAVLQSDAIRHDKTLTALASQMSGKYRTLFYRSTRDLEDVLVNEYSKDRDNVRSEAKSAIHQLTLF
jgi:hypothetical protein